jgi:hypothetical protein
MLNLARTHDFQVNLSPTSVHPAAVNPPSFNWPERNTTELYSLALKNVTSGEEWHWKEIRSPLQISFELPIGHYQWRLAVLEGDGTDTFSQWNEFEINDKLPNYLAPTAEQLFEQCNGREQWIMYFNEDVASIKEQCFDIYPKLKQTALQAVPMSKIRYPAHYQRGQEEGKREAIANVRKWIDRDLVVNALLYRIWGEQKHGIEALNRLLQLAEWSPEGPASLLRPCTWGDEVGLSLSRNLFLVYHWLAPLLNDSEKAFIRPMLVRIAKQLKERLEQDNFAQYPGHSHTSRLSGYLGVAALVLHREHDRAECEAWLNYSLMIYRGILPFYGGVDGSWVEGPFYASSYTKWHHPFFLSVERISGFSFYEHPFYKNFHKFARDFITPEQAIYPFGDGFWCRRDGKEWPGFFAQNPLRIYSARYGDSVDYQHSLQLERLISDYQLHLLDVVPTAKQLEYELDVRNKKPTAKKIEEQHTLNHYYSYAGLGKLMRRNMSLYYRASAFGNSSHRHGDQGNIAFFDQDVGVLIPTGSYGYRFGSRHHSEWTRQTIAHNLPLVGQLGQKLDDQGAIGEVVTRRNEADYEIVTLDLSQSYAQPLRHFYRTLVLVEEYGLVIVDSICLDDEQVLNWRLHSQLNATLSSSSSTILLTHSRRDLDQYKCKLLNHSDAESTLAHGYSEDMVFPAREIETDASERVVHLDWQLPASRTHNVVACCIREHKAFPQVRCTTDAETQNVVIELDIQNKTIFVPLFNQTVS